MRDTSSILNAALEYARANWRVIPLHGIKDGVCTCKAGKKCPAAGKHPLLASWPQHATCDERTITTWFQGSTWFNVGIVTGPESGVFVLDVDVKGQGEAALAALTQEHGPLPATRTVVTGSGGRHFYFQYPTLTVRSRAAIAPGLDVRGQGGLVVAPPSKHASGRTYQWADNGLAIAEAPPWLLGLVCDRGDRTREARAERDAVLRQGERNVGLTRIAGFMRRGGLSQAAIEEALQKENEQRCDPPLPRAEVAQIARSVSRYAPAADSARDDSPELAEQLLRFPLTDSGNAERLVLLYGEDIRYCHPQACWWVWTGQRWQEDRAGQVMEFAKAAARKLYQAAGEIADTEQKRQTALWAIRSESTEKKRAALISAQSERGIPIAPEAFDSEPFLLNCLNGTIDLRTGELREWRREDYCTRIAPVKYDPTARHALWERFLRDACGGNQELMDFLQRAVGYSLTGSTREEVLFFVHGPGGTGKSTFLEAVKSTLGDYAKTTDFETFLARRFARGPRDDIAELAGRRFVVSIEVDRGQKLAEGLIKWLTGGDTVRARRLYENGFEYVPQFKLWLAANHAPRVRHDDSAMWRRILRLPFECIVPPERRNPGLKKLLREEAGEAILNWAVEGCLRWQDEGLDVPDVVKTATEQYRLEMDPLRDFIDDCCVLVPGAWTSASNLRAAYESYCQDSGVRALTAKEVAECLRARGCQEERRRTGRGWRGIALTVSDNTQRGRQCDVTFSSRSTCVFNHLPEA